MDLRLNIENNGLVQSKVLKLEVAMCLSCEWL